MKPVFLKPVFLETLFPVLLLVHLGATFFLVGAMTHNLLCVRQELCDSLLRVHRRLGLTTLHVSHNQEEAFSIADRAGILHEGEVRQVGTMEELLRRPCDDPPRRHPCGARFARPESCGKRIAPQRGGGEGFRQPCASDL